MIEAVYHTTLSRDCSLRAALSALTVEHLDALLHDGDFVAALTDRSGLQVYTVDILREAMQRDHGLSEKHRKEMDEASVGATDLAKGLSTVCEEKQLLKDELKLKNQVLERAVKLTNGVYACKDCGKSFAGKLKKEFQLGRSYNEGDFYCICCGECGVRHTYAIL